MSAKRRTLRHDDRTRLLAALCVVPVVITGLYARSRRADADPSTWSGFLAMYTGDTLWSVLFFPVVDYAQTHSAVGLCLVCLPLGMAIFLLFQCVLKVPLFLLLPNWVQARLSTHARPLLVPSVHFFLSVAVAILIGACTHLVWDAFTHQGRWGTRLFPFLSAEIPAIGWSLPGYKCFQYGSTLIGLPLLPLLFALKLLRTEPHSIEEVLCFNPKAKAVGYGAIFLIPCVIAGIVLRSDATLYQSIGRIIKASGAIIMVALVVYSLVFHAVTSRNRNSLGRQRST